MELSKGEKMTFDSLTSKFKIENKEAFNLYLREIYQDLFNRVKDKNTNGITKLIFDKYFSLPGIIGDRFFKVLDKNNTNVLSLKDFIKGMTIIFCGNYEETVKFIFNFYDFNNDGLIDKEDIRVVLSYITLDDISENNDNSDNNKLKEINISYQKRVTSQEELFSILHKCFENIPNNKMDITTFRNTIENINSDIYLIIYLFLLENKPFTKENIKSYENKIENNPSKKKEDKSDLEKYIISPSKNTTFSPYRAFARNRGKQRTTIVQNEIDFMKMLKNANDSGQKISANPKLDFKRKGNKRKTVNFEVIKMKLKSIQEEDINYINNKNKINKKIKEERIKDLIKNKKKNKINIPEEHIQIKPAFEQNLKKKYKLKKYNNNINNINDKKDINQIFKDDSENEDEIINISEEEEEEENDDDEGILKHEGELYKYIDGKMRNLYFKLIHKDLYFYKNKSDTHHKGMHNLNGLFLQKEKSMIIDNITYYSFSVVYPSKTRIYYCPNETEYNEWISKLKIATGFINLLEIYEVKHKIGSGKFGVVKLGINKKTGENVAIKIMKKSSMDSSDLELVRTEIEILKICQHPNIIRLIQVFENSDYLYIITEYCSGGDFFSYLTDRDYKLKEKRASNIIHQMATAVYYMHSFGVVHRDLKPENVLMVNNDENSDIRILDFGLSKILGPYEKCNEPYGTLTFCAPEIIINEPYCKSVDLWSLGVITYLMVTGKLPFASDKENEIARQIVYDEPDFNKNRTWKNISQECLDFVKRLLEKDQDKRMNIKEVLEHKWIKMYDENKLSEKRKSVGGGEKDFELYSSFKDVDQKK